MLSATPADDEHSRARSSNTSSRQWLDILRAIDAAVCGTNHAHVQFSNVDAVYIRSSSLAIKPHLRYGIRN